MFTSMSNWKNNHNHSFFKQALAERLQTLKKEQKKNTLRSTVVKFLTLTLSFSQSKIKKKTPNSRPLFQYPLTDRLLSLNKDS